MAKPPHLRELGPGHWRWRHRDPTAKGAAIGAVVFFVVVGGLAALRDPGRIAGLAAGAVFCALLFGPVFLCLYLATNRTQELQIGWEGLRAGKAPAARRPLVPRAQIRAVVGVRSDVRVQRGRVLKLQLWLVRGNGRTEAVKLLIGNLAGLRFLVETTGQGLGLPPELAPPDAMHPSAARSWAAGLASGVSPSPVSQG